MNDPLTQSGTELYDAIVDEMPDEEFTDDYPAEALLVVAHGIKRILCSGLTEVVLNERDHIMPSDPNWFSGNSFAMTVAIGQYRRLIDESIAVAALMKLGCGDSAWHVLGGMSGQLVNLALSELNPDWAIARAKIAIGSSTEAAAFGHRRDCRINLPDLQLELALLGLESPGPPENEPKSEALSQALVAIHLGRDAAVQALPPQDLDPRFAGHAEPDETSQLLWHTTADVLLLATELLEKVMRELCADDIYWQGITAGLQTAIADISPGQGQPQTDAA
ncbi:hypothetical protein [Rhodococcus tukisamuensis]|uniref:Uncharacterized protein n=1 Tax=Rhodococcus tukisamuensis TaxID=168276 RepID=A0A1G7B3Y0_9NOCA|nr:hypothetical protein [Rhodococcus tukisamuensis]SDE21741.1 hypothetical protein SAMN05444580_11265 [Rhodococcus tukisamuensis]